MIKINFSILNSLANKFYYTESKTLLKYYFATISLFSLFIDFPKYWQWNKADLCWGCF